MASPPLVVAAAAAGSGGESSSGSEETGTAPPGRDLAVLFEQAAERLPALLPAASKEQLLYLYARYKQVRREWGRGLAPGAPRLWKRPWARRKERGAGGLVYPSARAWGSLGACVDTAQNVAMQVRKVA